MKRVVERILNLLAFLLTVDRPVTADEIRHTVAGYDQPTDEAFRRTFERDKDLIRQLGIPLEMRPTDAWEVEHGYSVPPDEYALEDPGLTDEERAALWLAARMVHLGGSAPGLGPILKLGGAPGAAGAEPIAADLGSAKDLTDLFAAVSERRLVRFRYRDTPRRVEPYGLAHRRGHWYLFGLERGGTEVKTFRVDRMVAAVTEADPGAFLRPKNFRVEAVASAAPWEMGGDDIEATVRFDAEVAWWARRQLPTSATVDANEDGSIDVRLRVANRDAFTGWLLGFEDQAELVAPEDLRSAFIGHVVGAS